METAMLTVVFVVGACIGSFLNVCITRWPKRLSVVKPRSRCPNCERPVGPLENIPLVSWLMLRGRCRGCGIPISSMYPIVELCIAVLWTLSFAHFDLTFTALRVAIFGTILFGVAVTDARDYIIPDGFTITGFLWNVAAAVYAVMIGEKVLFAAPGEALIGACVGAGSIAIVAWLGEAALKKEAMGFGDVTLMAMAGSALGAERALIAVFVGAFLGAFVFLAVVYPITWFRARSTKTEFNPPLVPFGVFLAPASLIVLLWGEELKAWWWIITAAPGT